MSAVPLSKYLMEFGPDGRVATNGALSELGRRGPADNPSAKLAQEYTRGVEEARAAADAEYTIKLAERQVWFERQLTAERERWTAEQAEKLATSLESGLREVEARIAETAARVLKPFLVAQLRQVVIAELQESLNVLLAKDPGVALSISGPEDLLQALRARFADRTLAATYQASTGCEVRIEVGQTVLETRLAAWIEKIDGVTA